jgi:transcriptional regulator with XRE-family HTH domain
LITGNQIRSARALLNWTAEETAERAGVSRQTLIKFERYDIVPPSRTQILLELKRIFEEAGIEFIGAPDEGPGLRLWKKSRDR